MNLIAQAIALMIGFYAVFIIAHLFGG